MKMKKKTAIIITSIIIGVCSTIPTEHSFAASYEYDELNRLTRVIYDNVKSIEYIYDTAGNITHQVTTSLAGNSIYEKFDFNDYAILACHWLEEDWSRIDSQSDNIIPDASNEIDMTYLAMLAQRWLDET